MLRASMGTWGNYATTIGFQILFAARYGSESAASVFVIVFGLAISIGSLATSSVQAVLLPRLLDAEGRLLRGSVAALGAVVAAALFVLAATAALSHPIGQLIGPHVHLSEEAITAAVPAAALFVFLQVCASAFMSLGLARGQRFIPAFAPAVPSTAGILAMVAGGRLSPASLLLWLAVGGVCEVALLAATVRRPLHLAAGKHPRVGLVALLTAGQFGLLALIAPLERVFSAIHGEGGAADYNYAFRSLAIVQQLLVGGLVLAVLGDWAKLIRESDRSHVRRSLVRTTVGALVAVSLAAALAIVAGRRLVELAYEHGAFNASDAKHVTLLLILMLPGFCAEAIGLLLSQALLAARHNGAAIGIGVFHFLIRATLIVVLGTRYGAKGVAIAYSIALVTALLVQVVVVVRLSLADARDMPILRYGAVIAVGTVVTALGLDRTSHSFPVPASVGVVLACFAILAFLARPTLHRTVAGVAAK
jgi:putative peptidoglycan lipid II flippase